jgi:hypothetical protein
MPGRTFMDNRITPFLWMLPKQAKVGQQYYAIFAGADISGHFRTAALEKKFWTPPKPDGNGLSPKSGQDSTYFSQKAHQTVPNRSKTVSADCFEDARIWYLSPSAIAALLLRPCLDLMGEKRTERRWALDFEARRQWANVCRERTQKEAWTGFMGKMAQFTLHFCQDQVKIGNLAKLLHGCSA